VSALLHTNFRRTARRGLNGLGRILTRNALRAWHAVVAASDERYRVISESGLFDADFYLANNPDVARADVNPLRHYIAHGAAEGRDPNPFFSTSAYFEDLCQPANLAANPLAHYLLNASIRRELRSLLWAAGDPSQWTDYQRQLVESALCYPRRQRDRGAFVSEAGSEVRPALLVAVHDLPPYGAEAVALSVVRELVLSRRVNVYVLLEPGGLLTGQFQALAPSVVLHRMNDAGLEAHALDTLIETLLMLGVDRAICSGVLTGDSAERLKRHGLFVVTTIHESPASIHASGAADLLRRAHASSDHLVFRSTRAQDLVFREFALSPASCLIRAHPVVLPNPFLDERRFARMELEKRLGIAETAAVVVASGAAGQRNGFDLFVQVAREVTQTSLHKPVHFVWIGDADGEFTQLCLGDIESCGLRGRVHLTGPRQYAPLFFAASDVFVQPSREDPFGDECMAAMDAGLPIVAFDSVCGMDEVLEPDATVRVPYLDVHEMSAAVSGALDNIRWREKVGSAARRRVMERFQSSDYVDFLLGLMRPN
jgi:glycosyltransferase involved in cell wall biosynthesis